jgi:hypothetical protein|tara:strand:+ start:5649 stop:6179 length:531 start_codon:yes stop_codon:yes gene_type:complete
LSKTAQEQLHDRCNAIEESYEFMLAYAAQGVSGAPGSQTGGQVREYLTRADTALTGLAGIFRALVVDAVGRGDASRDAPPRRAGLRRILRWVRALVRPWGGLRRKVDSADIYEAFIQMLERDAGDAQSALRLALAQSAISSQLVDNLNASIHVRTLLTDLFLIDEILKQRIADASR